MFSCSVKRVNVQDVYEGKDSIFIRLRYTSLGMRPVITIVDVTCHDFSTYLGCDLSSYD